MCSPRNSTLVPQKFMKLPNGLSMYQKLKYPFLVELPFDKECQGKIFGAMIFFFFKSIFKCILIHLLVRCYSSVKHLC